MSQSTEPTDEQSTPEHQSVHRDYILNIRVVEAMTTEGITTYRFDAPRHKNIEFADPALAELYADIYFDVNGFEERGTGDRGVPPAIVQAGRDTLAAYFLTQPGIDIHWVASFYGKKPEKIRRYVSRVRTRADEVRKKAAERDIDRIE